MLAVAGLLPQIRKLAVTGITDGVSAVWIGYGVVTNLTWTAYLGSQSLWPAVPSTAIVATMYGVALLMLARAGRSVARPLRWAAALTTGFCAVALVGGWRSLGVVLGLSFAVQVAPSVWEAYRTWAPRGVAPGTWVIALAEGVLWGCYGWWQRDTALLLFAVTAIVASVAMLARYQATRRRWEPLPARSG